MTKTYPHLSFVYFTTARLLVQFRLSQDTPYDELITTLHSRLQYPDNRKVVKLKYRSPPLDAWWKFKFTWQRIRLRWMCRFVDQQKMLSRCCNIHSFPFIIIFNLIFCIHYVISLNELIWMNGTICVKCLWILPRQKFVSVLTNSPNKLNSQVHLRIHLIF